MIESTVQRKSLMLFDLLTISTFYLCVASFLGALAYMYFVTNGELHILPAGAAALLVFINYSLDTLSGISDEDAWNKPKRYIYKELYGKYHLMLVAAAFCCLMIAGFVHSPRLGISLIIPEIALVLYSGKLPFMPRLKNVLFVKNSFVGVMWAYTLVIIPVMYLNIPFSDRVWIAFLHQVLVSIVSSLAFDIHDVVGDQAEGIKTVPLVIGRGNTLWLGFLLNTVYLLFILSVGITRWDIGFTALLAGNLYIYFYLGSFYYVKSVDLLNVLTDLTDYVPALILMMFAPHLHLLL